MDKQQYIEAVAKAKSKKMPSTPNVPQCCATCELLSRTGECEAYGEYPPLEFIKTENECTEWFYIPF